MQQDTEGEPKGPPFSADHVRLYAENKALRTSEADLKERNARLDTENRHLRRCLDALHELIERLS